MDVPRRHFVRSLAIMCMGIPASGFTVGCATWSSRDGVETLLDAQETHRLTKNQNSLRVKLDAINLVGDRIGDPVVDQFWKRLDTASLDYATRARLSNNGIRVGVLRHQELLASIESLASPADDNVENFLASANVAGELSRRGRTIGLKRGKPQEWPTRHPLVGKHVILLKEGGEIHGRTLLAPQPTLTLRANPSPIDETAEITVHPAIDYGDAKPSYVASESAIRIDSRRERWSLDPCVIRWRAVQGESLILGRLPEGGPVADLLFQATRPDGQKEETLLVLRYLGE